MDLFSQLNQSLPVLPQNTTFIKQSLSDKAFSIENLDSKNHSKEPRNLHFSGSQSDDEFEEESEDENVNFKLTKQKEKSQQDNKSQLKIMQDFKLYSDGNEATTEEVSSSAVASQQPNINSLYDDMDQEMRKSIINSSFDIPINPLTNEEYDIGFYGCRFKDSLEMHKAFANRSNDSYKFKFPPNINVLEAMATAQRRKKEEVPREFNGMNPKLTAQQGIINPNIFKQPSLIFDSRYECGNLDMAIQIKDNEYDLYMRVDSNTRGHHQWFNFTVLNGSVKGRVKFNIVNFTKNASLYHQGMKINIHSQKDHDHRKQHGQQIINDGWIKGGENILYKLSKLCQQGFGQRNNNFIRMRKYFQVSFEHDFQYENDKVQFSYSVPYSYSRLYNFLKTINREHHLQIPETHNQFIKETQLCKSISGLEVPILTITSRINKQNFEEIDATEFLTNEVAENETQTPPLNKYKKYIIVCSRVHPGETNASFIMEGFLKFITSTTNSEAIELRKRIIFKIIPMTNPDGVIIGNYRTSLCGNDLNRQFINPNTKLHPTVCSIKALVSGIIENSKEQEPISAFIDIHGHSRKKSIFIYGPYFPLHNERYLKMRVLPKLLSERTEMFRFYSCKFRIQKSKLKAARVVLWKEFGIMNCFTLEASFHGYINKERQTIHLTTENLMKMGEILGNGFYEYHTLIEEDEKQRLIVKQQIKNKKKRMKAKDLVQAYSKQQEQQIQGGGQAKSKIQILDQNFSSDQDENRQFKKHTIALDRSNVNLEGNDRYSKGLPNYALPTKRSQSFNIRDSSQFNRNQQKDLINQIQSIQNIGGVDVVIEVKKSAEHSSINSIKDDESNPSQQDSNPQENNDQDRSKIDLISRKQKTKSALQKSENQQTQKRTLKSIYKLLKRDMKVINIQQPDNKGNDDLQNSEVKVQNQGISSDSDDDDDEDGGDCCEDENSEGHDDLSPSELQELQNDIIKAIESFDRMYNKSVLRGKKGKKKGKIQGEMSNLKSIQIDRMNNEEMQKDQNSYPNKEPYTSKNQKKTQQVGQIITTQQNLTNSFINTGVQKNQLKKQANQLQQIPNTNRIIKNDNIPSQYQKFISQNQSAGRQVIGMVYGDKMQNLSTQPLQVSGLILKHNQNQMNQQNQSLNKSKYSDVSKFQVSDQSDKDQQKIVYQGVSSNVRNLLKYGPQNLGNIVSLNQRNSLLAGSGQQMIQSRSQDKYKVNDTNQSQQEVPFMKSFEQFQGQGKFISKSSNQRPYYNQQQYQVQENLSIQSYQKEQQQQQYDQNNPSIQNSRMRLASQSKSSRILITSDQDIPSTINTKSNRQQVGVASLKTPSSKIIQNQGIVIIGTPKQQQQQANYDENAKSKTNRPYSFSTHIGDGLNFKPAPFEKSYGGTHQNNLHNRREQNVGLLSNQQNHQMYKSDNDRQQPHYRQTFFSEQQQQQYIQQQQQQQQQMSMSNNQSLIIQNIIIGNFHNDQRIQITSPNSTINDNNIDINQELIREQLLQKHKKKRRKSKRKSKDKRFMKLNESQLVNQNNGVIGQSYIYGGDISKNNLITTALTDIARAQITGIKYQFSGQNEITNPYSENMNSNEKKRKINNNSNIQNSISNNVSTNNMPSDGEYEEQRVSNKRSSVQSQQPNLNHNKKNSIEYEQLAKNQEHMKESVLGQNYIYNLRPLKDLIVNNLNQVKYVKNQSSVEQPSRKGGIIGRQLHNGLKETSHTTETSRLSKQTLRLRESKQ
ncbi:UNKNOWN [Stylonychia lemnae]|uniref:Peptidase M14 domain-containing protein n=1 Tax=Stylonychia lemnae TaxID=5949 RepID=A0A078A4V7_STYLE|nr:UNKNOWN [Stylonychia lemnae]|eukprot:CDW76600.1 UNKNOWN [Stylonychia lemnae]